MQIIKDKQLDNDDWSFLPDDAAAPQGNVIVSVERLTSEFDSLVKREGKLGLRLLPDNNVAAIADYLPQLALVELYFSDLTDGRLFSHSWLLRNRYNFTGEIRASGQFLPDQVYYLSRVGVNAFNPENQAHISSMLAALNDFSVHYQESVH